MKQDPDALKNLKVHVEAVDIHNGLRGLSTQCPLALAIARHLEPGTTVSVGKDRILLGDWDAGESFISIALPARALTFRRQFDHDKPVKAFVFQITVPQRLINTNME